MRGNYVISKCVNGDKSEKERVRHYHCKSEFNIGNILFNKDVPNIEDLIKLLIYFTYNAPPVKSTGKVQMRGGTICPTKETICEVEDKQFILYGRYIFGYDDPYVLFKSEGTTIKLKQIEGKERVYDK